MRVCRVRTGPSGVLASGAPRLLRHGCTVITQQPLGPQKRTKVGVADVCAAAGSPWSVKSCAMLVADLTHFLDLPEAVPGPARRLAQHLADIVRAATAGDAGAPWTSALPCRRRPAHRPCAGRIRVLRREPDALIRWQCSVCDDEGVISNWEDSRYDLRRRRLILAVVPHELVVPDDTAATLRDLQVLDIDSERLVFRMRAHSEGAVLLATDAELHALVGLVVQEADQEHHRRRRRRLDAAVAALSSETSSPTPAD